MLLLLKNPSGQDLFLIINPPISENLNFPPISSVKIKYIKQQKTAVNRISFEIHKNFSDILLRQSLFISFLMAEKMIPQQQENSGRNYKNHIFRDQQSDHHSKTYKKQHKANQLFQFSCTFSFSLVCYSLCGYTLRNV